TPTFVKTSRQSGRRSKCQGGCWCDRSVATLFSLRYNSPLASRFDSKNNSGKRVAYVMLAAELSVEIQREFVAKQVQDKVRAFLVQSFQN
ncbi:hypothetical protein H257_19496, partial [Aphanomyces astaci]